MRDLSRRTQFETRIVVRTLFVREWPASQNKTANTYVIEIAIIIPSG